MGESSWADLETRAGLPDALRVLLEAHPRLGWEGSEGFDGLIRFWLERHVMFRRLLTQLLEETEARLDDTMEDQVHRKRLSRLGGMFLNELHVHHGVEDHHYFPVLVTRDSRLERGFEMLDTDHHALDAWLNGFQEAANSVIRSEGPASAREAASGLRGELVRMQRLLDRHLTDEEDLIVPVLLEYGTGGLPG